MTTHTPPQAPQCGRPAEPLTTPAAVADYIRTVLRRLDAGELDADAGEVRLRLCEELISGLRIMEAARCRQQMAAAERSLREIRAVCRARGR